MNVLFIVRRAECKHVVWTGGLVDTAAALRVVDGLRGSSCPTCGEIVHKVRLLPVTEPTSSFDAPPPAPRNTKYKLMKASNTDLKKTRQRLSEMGVETGGLAANLKEAALELTPPRRRRALAKIPVGLLQTYEPNAECIRFKDSAMPAIVFHQGLASYLFKMNRSLFPLMQFGSVGDDEVLRFVEDKKTRSALRVQAVDTALEFLGIGKPRSKVLVEIPTIARLLEMPLTRTMEAFILCHEYGHAVLNHADELRSVGRDLQFYLLERSRAMEFEADTWGQDAVTGAFTGRKNLESSLAMLDDMFDLLPDTATEMKQDISHAAPCVALLYFEFLDVIEERLASHEIDVAAQDALTRRRVRMAGKKATGHATHPSNRERFLALYSQISAHRNFTTHSWVRAFEDQLNEIKEDLDELIDQSRGVTGKTLTRRSQQPRSTAKGESNFWDDPRFPIDLASSMLEEALQRLDGEGEFNDFVPADNAAVSRRFERLKNEAAKHFGKGEYSEAERIFAQILDIGETAQSVNLYPLLGKCREKLGDQQGAIAAYNRCLELVPGSDVAAMCSFYLGRILFFDRQDPSGAESALTAATTSQFPDLRAQAIFWLGVIAHDRGDVETALRRFRDVYALRGRKFTLYPSVIPLAAINIGLVLEKRGQFTEAAKMFKYAREHRAIDPEDRAVAEQHLGAVRRRL